MSLCILITDPVFADIAFIIKKSVKILVSHQLLEKEEKMNLKKQVIMNMSICLRGKFFKLVLSHYIIMNIIVIFFCFKLAS